MSDSNLNQDVIWGIDDALGSVNSFILKGNHTMSKSNTARWNSFNKRITSYEKPITSEDIKKIVSENPNEKPGEQSEGCLYNSHTSQIVIFEPDTFSMEVFFKPYNGILPDTPNFEKVTVEF